MEDVGRKRNGGKIFMGDEVTANDSHVTAASSRLEAGARPRAEVAGQMGAGFPCSLPIIQSSVHSRRVCARARSARSRGFELHTLRHRFERQSRMEQKPVRDWEYICNMRPRQDTPLDVVRGDGLANRADNSFGSASATANAERYRFRFLCHPDNIFVE